MAPNHISAVQEEEVKEQIIEKPQFKAKIVWLNVTLFAYLHLSFLYGLYLMLTSAHWMTPLFAMAYAFISGIGVTAGYHRLWSHRAYKAKWPLRALLCVLATIGGQNDILEWSRDHRVHHKFTETDADPHNIKRGFFFAHMGWLMCKKHPEVGIKGKTVYLDDLWADPIVRFHRRFYIPMLIIFCFYVPTMIPVWFWGETLWNAFFVAAMGRYCVSLNFTWLVNSAAHKYGTRPMDKFIEARENAFVSFIGSGEGWHNYHHTFPWDYATSELGYKFNATKIFIDIMAFLGLAYDLKQATPDMVKYRKLKTGDGTRLPEDEKNEPHSAKVS